MKTEPNIKQIIVDLYNGGKTNAVISKATGLSERTLRRRISQLRLQGVLPYERLLPVGARIDYNEVKTDVLDFIRGGECVYDKEFLSVFDSTLTKALSKYKPYKKTSVKNNLKGDTLVIHLTDLHAGKLVKNEDGDVIFDKEIFIQRMNRLCTQVLKLVDRNISKSIQITDVVILSTGDLANGENIYATQAFDQELTPPEQVMLLVEIISKLILSLKDRGLNVSLYGVRGNHGRLSKEADPASNWDLMVYKVLDYWTRVCKLNIPIIYTESEYLTLDIKGYKYLIRHIAPEQSDTPAGRVKFNAWARQHGADVIVSGHWHHFGYADCDSIRIIRGGSVVGVDDLSESMAKQSSPIQLVWGVCDERPVTFFYCVDLKGD